MAPDDRETGGNPGPATDRHNAPVADPTPNVLDLVRAAVDRLDDLRKQDVEHAREMRETARMYEARLDKKDEQIRSAETARIDAIRLVDVQRADRAAEVQAAQQAALAEQLRATAEASRNEVAASASALMQTQAAELEPMKKDIRDLRDRQSQDVGGKEQVTESSTTARDELAVRQAEIQAKATAESKRMQMYGLIISVLIAAIGFYLTFHK